MKKMMKTLLIGGAFLLSTFAAGCGIISGFIHSKPACRHVYDNDCDAVCNECNEERVVAEHVWTVDECGEERYCSVCSFSDGEIIGHDWQNATCTTPKICLQCEETEGEALGHEYTDIRYDGEGHWFACPVCEEGDEESYELHAGVNPNCTTRGHCSTCLQSYGEIIPEAHNYSAVYVWADDYKSIDAFAECSYCDETQEERVETVFENHIAEAHFENEVFESQRLQRVISAVGIQADVLKTLVASALAADERDIYVIFAPDAPAEMVTAVREAITDSDAEDGSVHLTLADIERIPDNDLLITVDGVEIWRDGISFGEKSRNDDGSVSGDIISVSQLATVRMPHATYIGGSAFQNCSSLRSFYAPNAQTVGRTSFTGTLITEVDLPKATVIGESAFLRLALTAVNLPSAVELGITAFCNTNDDATGYTLYLTAEGDITIGNNCFYTGRSQPMLSEKINLVLNSNKKVSGKVWKGLRWKSISFQD